MVQSEDPIDDSKQDDVNVHLMDVRFVHSLKIDMKTCMEV